MKKLDITTIIAISTIAWIILIISHEVLGHGGAAYLNGGKLAYFDSMFARYVAPEGGFSFWQAKFNKSAGSLLNVLTMAGAALWFVKLRSKQTWLGYGLWVFVMYVAFQSGSYIAFSQFLHSTMDWQSILIGLEQPWLWRTLELVAGLLLIGFGFWFGRKYHYEFISPEQSIRLQKSKILIAPWLAASVVSIAAAFFVPILSDTPRWLMVLGGMGNSFNFLMFMPLVSLVPSKKENALRTELLDRSVPLIAVSVVAVILYVFVFGQGISLI